MATLLSFWLSSSNSEDDYKTVRIKKEMRDKSDPLSLPANAFIKRFRLSKEAFNFLLSELCFEGRMSTALPPKLQLAVTLSLLASGSFQHTVGNDYLMGMCQNAVCKTVNRVVNEIKDRICPNFIKFLPNESTSCMESFMQKYKLPGDKCII